MCHDLELSFCGFFVHVVALFTDCQVHPNYMRITVDFFKYTKLRIQSVECFSFHHKNENLVAIARTCGSRIRGQYFSMLNQGEYSILLFLEALRRFMQLTDFSEDSLRFLQVANNAHYEQCFLRTERGRLHFQCA